MTTAVQLVKIIMETKNLSNKEKKKADKIINLLTEIGFDYISNPVDALNYAKRINSIKKELQSL